MKRRLGAALAIVCCLVGGEDRARAEGNPVARGHLDKEVIRSAIHLHLGEVQRCYESGLVRKRDLTGRVMIQFVISADGSVASSVVQTSTLGDTEVERCIADAVGTWLFPKPDRHGIVIVSYPFVLRAAKD